MNLQSNHSQLIDWFKENNILVVEAEVNVGKTLSVLFTPDTDGINSFKAVLNTLNGRIVFHSYYYLSTDTYNEYLNYVNGLNDVDIYDEYIRLEKYKDKILHYSIYLIENSVVYAIEDEVEEADIFYKTQKILQKVIEYAQKNYIPDDMIGVYANKLANHENYPKTKNRNQKVLLAEQLFPELGEYDGNTYLIINNRAEAIYELEVKPLNEKKLMDNIQKLKNEGKNKVSICSILKISKHIVDKYY